jgi:hypothetical protein
MAAMILQGAIFITNTQWFLPAPLLLMRFSLSPAKPNYLQSKYSFWTVRAFGVIAGHKATASNSSTSAWVAIRQGLNLKYLSKVYNMVQSPGNNFQLFWEIEFLHLPVQFNKQQLKPTQTPPPPKVTQQRQMLMQ